MIHVYNACTFIDLSAYEYLQKCTKVGNTMSTQQVPSNSFNFTF